MSLSAGTRLGPYEVTALAGAGGMGEVYRAHDARLARDVALKVLPDSVADDEDRLLRFQREARVLASLNHPNIAQVFDLAQADGVTAIAMEWVDGRTLADVVAAGPIVVDDSIRFALQICEALEAAHELGVVHRDLKPANIKVRPDGTIKVLDFGLARSAQAPAAETETMAVTAPGTILGTVGYMAPEQAKGLEVGPQADIWAFGCVLYEMLTGQPAFSRGSPAETIACIISGAPDLEGLPAETPPGLVRLIGRCLEKPLRDRLHHLGDARADLLDVRSAPTPASHSARAGRWGLIVGAAVALAAVTAAAGWWLGRGNASPAAPPVVRLVAPFVDGPVGLAIGSHNLAISRDGASLAYAANGGLWIRRLKDKEAHAVGTAGADPFYSPDGLWVALFTNNDLVKVSVDGGPATVIASTTERPAGGAWLDDGTIVFATSAGVYRVPETGGTAKLIVAPARDRGEQLFATPAALPDGRHVLITVGTGATTPEFTTAVLDLETAAVTSVVEHASSARYVETGHLVYASGNTLRAIAFDPGTRQSAGPAIDFPDVEVGVARDNGIANYAVSASGTLVFLPPTNRQARASLVWLDRRGTEEQLAVEPGPYMYARLSPDGKRVALDVRGSTNRDIWILDLTRLTQTRLTDGPTEDMLPLWSRDGARVYFGSDREGNFDVYSQAADGADGAVLEVTAPGFQVPESFVPDGSSLIVLEDYVDTGVVALSGARRIEGLLHSPFQERLAQIAPDGQWMAYESDESGAAFEIYLRPYPSVRERREKVSKAGGRFPAWSADGNELFYVDPDGNMMAVPVRRSPDLVIGTPTPLFRWRQPPPVPSGRQYDVSPIDGRFLLLKAENPAEAGPTNVSIIVNWMSALQAR